ncbi:hypothetical protein GCM10010458_29260 [Microbacterium luteolum]|uniref:Helix-turn-helix domain-containing protein n=2 Tax=Microbacterium TaxID=33882 RepID=A0AAU7VT89_9MICO|nr:XRE family transcriptional regulator [Microbacterium luteolum]WDM41845.1 XRE family transcriptional regulator [Microbacterium luteolum]
MKTFDTADAGALLLDARRDAALTQAKLAELAATSQPSIAAIERGKRQPSAELLERILRAADYRPGIALARFDAPIRRLGAQYGISNIRVFGSVSRGSDHYGSDIDLLVDVEPNRSYFDIGGFVADVEALTGFPVDIVVDGPSRPAFLTDDQLVPL